MESLPAEGAREQRKGHAVALLAGKPEGAAHDEALVIEKVSTCSITALAVAPIISRFV